jgi:thiol-disulfide isomerase/thioredoxin
MRKKIICCVLLLISLGLSAHDKPPEVQLESLIKQHQGKIVYVDFWASWCAPCQHAFVWMKTLDEKFDGKVKVITVNMDADKEDALTFLHKFPASFPVVYNPSMSIGKANQLKGMPSSMIYNQNGEKVVQLTGFNLDKILQYEAILTELAKK